MPYNLLLYPLQIVFIVSAVFVAVLLFTLSGAVYAKSSVRRAKADVAAGDYAAALEKFGKIKKHSAGIGKINAEYYIAYTYLAAEDYEKFFASVESMRTYRGEVTKIYRTDCVYLLVIARLLRREKEGAEKALEVFRSALKADEAFARRFGDYEKFFAACLAKLGGAESGETAETIRALQKDGAGSVLIAKLARAFSI